MTQNKTEEFLAGRDRLMLITGAAGFVGRKVVENLLNRGYRNLRCLVRPSGDINGLRRLLEQCPGSENVELVKGNLLSTEDCRTAVQGVEVIYHLAAARGEKSFPESYRNSVVTTRNLLEAAANQKSLKRFVNVSSFAVYTNVHPGKNQLDESCPVEPRPELRGTAYDFAKAKQDEIVIEYSKNFNIPMVIVRPGYIFGPGNEAITSRVGIGTFGIFMHLGGSNRIPFTYIDNCADAIALAGLTDGIDGEVFNVVDDDLPSSRQFLRLYKKNVRRFSSLYVPHVLSFALCHFWEKYSAWSEGQLPPAFNHRIWQANWKKTRYSNDKIKARLGWTPKISMSEGLSRYFKSCRDLKQHA